MHETIPAPDDLPRTIARLPVTDAGVPIPWMVNPSDGSMNMERIEHAMHRSLCGLCERPLNSYRYLLFPSPQFIINRITPLPALHARCAIWWLRSPWWEGGPGLLASLEQSSHYHLIEMHDSPHPYLQPDASTPSPSVSWWLHGQLASPAEILRQLAAAAATMREFIDNADQDSGLSLLVAAAKLRAGLPTSQINSSADSLD